MIGVGSEQLAPCRSRQPALVDFLVFYRPAVPVVVTLRAENEEVDKRGMEEQMLYALEAFIGRADG